MADLFAPPTKEEVSRAQQDRIFSPPTPEELGAFQPKQPVPPPDSPLERFSKAGLKAFETAGSVWDRYTGAPTRAAVSAAQKGEGVTGAAKAFGRQFGEAPELAPTGQEIAAEAGLSTTEKYKTPFKGIDQRSLQVTPAQVGGFGVDVLADWTNVIPVGAVAKLGKSGASVAGKTALKTGAKVTTGAAEKIVAKTGTEAAVTAVKETAKGTKEALGKLFNPKVSGDFKELSEIAVKHGINPEDLPESIEFGDTSIISRASRQRREGILGEAPLTRYQNTLRQVREATDNTIARIGGGTVLSPVDAGNLIRVSYDDAVDKFFDTVDTSYDTVIKDYPGLKISTAQTEKLNSALNGIEKFAKGRVARGVTGLQEEQGRRLLNSVAAIRNTNGSFKQTVEALRDIGEASFKSQNTLAAVPADVAKMRKLYGDISEALIDTVRTDVQHGQDIAGALQINNARMTEFFGNKSAIEGVVGNRAVAPENVFKSLVVNGDTRKIAALKAILPPETIAQLKAATLNSMIKRTDDFGFNFNQVKGAMENKQAVLSELLTPAEAAEIADVVRLGDRFGPAVLSTSGTGASNVIKDIPGNIQNAIFNDAFIESMKQRARGAAIEAGPPAPPAAAAKVVVPDRIELPGLTRGKTEKALKGAQIYSTRPTDERMQQVEAIRRRMSRKLGE